MPRRANVVIVIAIALLIGAGAFAGASCSSSSNNTATADGSADGRQRDAASGEPGTSQGDGGALSGDAAPDDSFGGFPGTWHAVPGMPTVCDTLQMADVPAAHASKWVACPSGRTGCRKLDTSWTQNTGWLVHWSQGADPNRLVNGKPFFMHRRLWPPKTPYPGGEMIAWMILIEPLDGPPVSVTVGNPIWVNNRPRSCSLEMAFGDYGVGFYAFPRDVRIDPQTDNGTNDLLVGWAPWSTPTSFSSTLATVMEFGLSKDIGYVLEPTLGEKSMWFTTRAPRSVATFQIDTKTKRLLNNSFPSEQATPVGADPNGGAFVFDTAQAAIAFAKDDGTTTRVVTPIAPQIVTRKALDRSNGKNDLIWVESDTGLDYANSVLWTSTYATSEATLVRRKIARLNDAVGRGGARGVANRGVFLSLIGRNEALITRLSDGMGWKIVGEPGERMFDPIWVDDDDVLIEIAPDPFPTSQYRPSGVLRIARSSLGPPTVSSGL